MSGELSSWLDALESAWVDPLTASIEEIEALLARRQEILADLQTIDAESLAPAMKSEICERITRVHARDQLLVLALHKRMEVIANQLAGAAKGKAAARGYRAPVQEDAKLFVRPA